MNEHKEEKNNNKKRKQGLEADTRMSRKNSSSSTRLKKINGESCKEKRTRNDFNNDRSQDQDI
eukprot:CAMPEP_0184691564 /NCGR_PEP_ID=MMETSP0313-20130426/384_1 /TAXON_ID=2792 /ORGANISM="Porphyridium aerugineum, Strain SAG 1380-2" /LENGTH=62 /DNA_ID=CAMNT_0027149307 /DNA_START=57 /DNA_END=242 /DNA_ORIENTATION=+